MTNLYCSLSIFLYILWHFPNVCVWSVSQDALSKKHGNRKMSHSGWDSHILCRFGHFGTFSEIFVFGYFHKMLCEISNNFCRQPIWDLSEKISPREIHSSLKKHGNRKMSHFRLKRAHFVSFCGHFGTFSEIFLFWNFHKPREINKSLKLHEKSKIDTFKSIIHKSSPHLCHFHAIVDHKCLRVIFGDFGIWIA